MDFNKPEPELIEQPKPADPASSLRTGGCVGCWAAGYCIAYAPMSAVQPPPACPLVPKPAGRPRPRPHIPSKN